MKKRIAGVALTLMTVAAFAIFGVTTAKGGGVQNNPNWTCLERSVGEGVQGVRSEFGLTPAEYDDYLNETYSFTFNSFGDVLKNCREAPTP